MTRSPLISTTLSRLRDFVRDESGMFQLTHLCGFMGMASDAIVKSVQHFEITIASSATTGTATISSVNTAKAALIYAGFYSPFTSTGLNRNYASIDLTNSTTVTATRNTSDTFAVVVRGCVVEFESSAVTSVQHGTITMTATTSNTATISSVDTSRSVVFYLGQNVTYTGTSPGTGIGAVELTNSTTVTATRAQGTSNVTVGYCVVEFATGIIKSVQHQTFTSTSSNTSDTQTISSVDTNNSLIVYGGTNCNITSETTFFYTVVLTNGTTVTLTRTATGTTSRTVKYAVLEFNPGYLKSLQSGTTTIGSGSTGQTTTITSVSTGKAALFWGGIQPSSTTDSNLYAATRLQDATTVDCDRNTSGTNTVINAWQVVEFL